MDYSFHGIEKRQTRLSTSPLRSVISSMVFCFLNFIIFRVAQMVKRLSAMQETWVRSLGWEDPLEKETAAHSSILVWKILWTAEPGRLPSTGSQRVGHDWATSLSLSLYVYNTSCLSIQPLIDIWVAYTSGLLWIVLLWPWVYKYLSETLLPDISTGSGTAGSFFFIVIFLNFLKGLHTVFHSSYDTL